MLMLIKKEAAETAASPCPRELPFNPIGAAPVAAAFVLTERVALMRPPSPIVVMNDDPRLWRISESLMRVPADVAGANDGRRCAHGRRRQQTSAKRCTCEGLTH